MLHTPIRSWDPLKPLDPFAAEKKFTDLKNNFQGLHKVMVEDFSWNIIPCFTFWENIKTISILDIENYRFI